MPLVLNYLYSILKIELLCVLLLNTVLTSNKSNVHVLINCSFIHHVL